jgi:hypothetical protein
VAIRLHRFRLAEIVGPTRVDVVVGVARRADSRLVSDRGELEPIVTAVPEIIPLLSRAKQNGVLCQREPLVKSGDRLRLRAVVERTNRPIGAGDRASGRERLVVRDDLAAVTIDDVLELPAV